MKKWTSKEFIDARTMALNGLCADEIGEALGRSEQAVVDKFKYNKLKILPRKSVRFHPGQLGLNNGRAPRPLASTVAERDRRICAPYRDQAAAFNGDPRVGYSALDRRQG